MYYSVVCIRPLPPRYARHLPLRGRQEGQAKAHTSNNISQHNPQSSPSAMPAPFQGAYKRLVVSTNLSN